MINKTKLLTEVSFMLSKKKWRNYEELLRIISTISKRHLAPHYGVEIAFNVVEDVDGKLNAFIRVYRDLVDEDDQKIQEHVIVFMYHLIQRDRLTYFCRPYHANIDKNFCSVVDKSGDLCKSFWPNDDKYHQENPNSIIL